MANMTNLLNLQLPCVVVTITTDKTQAYIGDIIVITVNTEPVGAYTIILRDQYGNFIGSCDTNSVDGKCIINWNTDGLSHGSYTITAAVGVQCFNTVPTTITLTSRHTELLTVIAISVIFAVAYREYKGYKRLEGKQHYKGR